MFFLTIINIFTLLMALLSNPTININGCRENEVSVVKSQKIIVSSQISNIVKRDPVTIAIVLNNGTSIVPSDIVVKSDIIATAMQFIGIPYVVNAANPEIGFDCSGFIMYVYKLHGIDLPHSSIQQASLGHVISESEAQPGDLVFWGGHIAFWVAPGTMLDSAVEGTTIQFRSIWGNPQIIRLDV